MRLFQPWLEFGENQFAYRNGRGHRDALLFNILSLLDFLENGKMIALYCSDVEGAFDRVDKTYLLQRFLSSKPPLQLAKILESWLEDRNANVVVSGCFPRNLPLANSVFQGTALGRPLWNEHFSTAKQAIRKAGFNESIYADDLNAFRVFPRNTNFAEICRETEKCQQELHHWGAGNRVVFDPQKECKHVIGRISFENSFSRF